MYRKMRWRQYGLLVCSVLLFSTCAENPPPISAGFNNPKQHFAYILQCDNNCTTLANRVQQLGGVVSHHYQNLPLISVRLHPRALSLLNTNGQKPKVFKDRLIQSPQPFTRLANQKINNPKSQLIHLNGLGASLKAVDKFHQSNGRKQALDLNRISGGTISVNNFSLNNRVNGANRIHEKGFIGQGVVVAIIDTGTANNPDVVPMLTDTVLGGENFVLDVVDEPSATSTLNDEHGTWVASMIAAHGEVIVPADNLLAQSVLEHAPNSIIPLGDDPINPIEYAIPMVGTAPGASIYALKVFPADGSGAPTSRVIEAMDRVLTLKQNFDSGMPADPVAGDGSEDNPFIYDSLNIQVVNLSLGGASLFPGYEIDELLTVAMLQNDISVVTAAGNEGFSAITGGGPGSGLGTLNVGAASSVVHERILRDLQEGLGTGLAFRPTEHMQIAHFSSRGPSADGRQNIHIVANGYASFVQGADGHISFVSGTSFAAPTVAGAVASLRSAFPEQHATDVRSALVLSANPNLIGNLSGPYDQGYGFLNIVGAFDLLEQYDDDDELSNPLPTDVAAGFNSRVSQNMQNLGFDILRLDERETNVEVELRPGEVQQFFIATRADSHDLFVNIKSIEADLPPGQQNTIFGDDLVVSIVDSMTSVDHTRVRAFISQPEEFHIVHPQPGLIRVSFMGDWTNVGLIEAEIGLRLVSEPLSRSVAEGEIRDAESHVYFFNIPENTEFAVFDLSWEKHWGFYPTHDIDLLLFDPMENIYTDGATLMNPESLLLDIPMPGTWTLIVDGYALHNFEDEYELRSFDQNGNPIPVN